MRGPPGGDDLRASERWTCYGLDIQYSFDGASLLGTAGALKQSLPKLGDSFLTLYGDSYLLCDYSKVAREFTASGKQALMTVFRNEGKWDTSNVEFANGKILAYNKEERTPRMKYIDYGWAHFSPRRSTAYRLGRRAIWRSSTDEFWRRGNWRESKFGSDFMRLDSERDWKRRRDSSLHGEWKEHESGIDVRERFPGGGGTDSSRLDTASLETAARMIGELRDTGGRLFILGVGGSAANASHAVNDFERLQGLKRTLRRTMFRS